MAHTPDFDLDDLLRVLSPFIENQAEGSKEREAFKLAQAALLYIRDTKKEDDFARYYKAFSNTSFTVAVSHEFATREDADRWLVSGKAEHAERVKIAGQGFMVVQLPGRLTFMSAPLPEELESEEGKPDSD
jgi:hypothetical protein